MLSVDVGPIRCYATTKIINMCHCRHDANCESFFFRMTSLHILTLRSTSSTCSNLLSFQMVRRCSPLICSIVVWHALFVVHCACGLTLDSDGTKLFRIRCATAATHALFVRFPSHMQIRSGKKCNWIGCLASSTLSSGMRSEMKYISQQSDACNANSVEVTNAYTLCRRQMIKNGCIDSSLSVRNIRCSSFST